MPDPRDVIRPPITDESGYSVRGRDLIFLHISQDQIGAWHCRERPLGMSTIQFAAFVAGLRTALQQDDVPPSDCDLRLQGSSAAFFSGAHKKMVTERDELSDLFRDLRNRVPEAWELDETERRLHVEWVVDGIFPAQRPFDAMFRLGIDRNPSDYDLQISSDTLVDRCTAKLRSLGQEPTTLRTQHPSYNFVRKDLVEDVAPHLYLYRLRMTDALMRDISIAVFPSTGPPDLSSHPVISSHFRETDWLLSRPRHEES